MAKKKEKEVKQQPVQGEAESQPQKKTASKSKAVSNAEGNIAMYAFNARIIGSHRAVFDAEVPTMTI